MQSDNRIQERLSDRPLGPISEQLALLYLEKVTFLRTDHSIKTPEQLADAFAAARRAIFYALSKDKDLNPNF